MDPTEQTFVDTLQKKLVPIIQSDKPGVDRRGDINNEIIHCTHDYDTQMKTSITQQERSAPDPCNLALLYSYIQVCMLVYSNDGGASTALLICGVNSRSSARAFCSTTVAQSWRIRL